jgi:hypothetical protein
LIQIQNSKLTQVACPQKLHRGIQAAFESNSTQCKITVLLSKAAAVERARQAACSCGLPSCTCTWMTQLSDKQRQCLDIYASRHADKFNGAGHGIFHLGDNPEFRQVYRKHKHVQHAH